MQLPKLLKRLTKIPRPALPRNWRLPLFLSTVVILVLLAFWNLFSRLAPTFNVSSIPFELLDVVVILVGLLIIVLIGGYRLNWSWTGFGYHSIPKRENHDVRLPRTLWDWMQLIIIPAVLAGAAYSFTAWNSSTQTRVSEDNNRETALQNYLDKMSTYVEERGESESPDDAELQKIVRTKTLTMLRRLDVDRSKIVIQFLRDSELISSTTALVDLHDVDLSKADLHDNDLHGVGLANANLRSTSFRGANLRGADLRKADLTGADLSKADLFGAKLSDAILGGANLGDAELSSADLSGCDLSATNMTGSHLRISILKDADLSGADLRRAELRGTDLRNVDLSAAHLNTAELRGAILTGANLHGADLTQADLSGANLSDVDLSGANLTNADLSGADLRGATLTGAIMSGANLNGAKITREQVESAGTPSR